MHDPMTQICSFPSYNARCWMEKRRWIPKWLAHLTLFTLWHKDPERKGNDDSCGWFMRAGHGDAAMLEKIVRRFEFDWDRTYTSEGDKGTVYFCGWFCPNGDPHLSVMGIAVNWFFLAALEYFGSRDKAMRFCQAHLFEILHFAENPVDSLFDGITRKFEIGCGEKHTAERRQQRIRSMAACIYGWILREDRRWYRHPRWHIHHWRFQIHPWQQFRHAWLDRCCKCGKGFKWGESCITDWNHTKVWHDRCDNSIKTPCEQPAQTQTEAGV